MSIILTQLDDPILKMQETIDQKYRGIDIFEARKINSGFFSFAMNPTNRGVLINENEVKSKARFLGEVFKLPAMDKGAVDTNAGARIQGDIPAAASTTAFATGVTQTIQVHFSMRPADNYGNEMNYRAELVRKIMQAEHSLISQAEAFLKAQVDTGISQADFSDAYPIVADVFQVPNADYKKVLTTLQAIYLSNLYPTNDISVVANPMYAAAIAEILQFGTANQQNQALSLVGKQMYFSTEIVPGALEDFNFYTLIPGSIELVNTNEPDALLKHGEGLTAAKGTMRLPMLGMEVGVYTQKKMLGNGTTTTLEERWEFATDLHAFLPYYSTPVTDPSSIYKYAILS